MQHAVLLGVLLVALAFCISPDRLQNQQSGYTLNTSNLFRDKLVYKSIEERSTLIVHKPVKAPRSLLELVGQAKENRANLNVKQPNLPDRVIGSLPDDYFRFIPEYVGTVVPGADGISWTSPCFKQHSAKAEKTDDGYQITFDTEEKKGWFCDDGYLIATTQSFHIEYFEFTGHWHLKWTGDLPAASQYDIEKNGFRIFRFSDDIDMTLVDVWETLQLFLGALIQHQVPDWTAEDNLKFMKDYMNVTFETRETDLVTLPEDQIQSGDFLGVIRMDGLDPMLAWGMGSHTGHTTIAVRMNGALHVCESTTNSMYWPTNGIQCTPWAQWIKQAHAADYNVVHLPLSPHYAKVFNETAAVEFFNSVKGLPYGFHNMLFGWIDTPEDNYPPPLTSHFAMILFGLVDDIIKLNDTIDIWAQALNHRLGTTGLSTRECYAEAGKRGIAFTQLVTIPEQDSWNYRSANDVVGPAMVCDVFVMRMWKAAGIFGDIADEIQATEFTNWDAYSLNIFDGDYKRPAQCVQADPDSQFCQLMGKYRMTLPGYNTVKPFPHMREKCPSKPPKYEKPPMC